MTTALLSRALLALGLAMAALPVTSAAYAQNDCRFLCAPTLKVEPTVTVSNLFARPRVQPLPVGESARVARAAAFETILAVDVPTELPRLGFTIETIWTTSSLELELETNFHWLTAAHTKGWVTSHFDVVDKFSPAGRPDDANAYTHKLNLELDTAVAVFNWLPPGQWLRRLELEGSLDYVGTGLPKRGDEIPPGQLYLDDASPWSFSFVVVIPIAPFR
jgi:hypothetical protein